MKNLIVLLFAAIVGLYGCYTFNSNLSAKKIIQDNYSIQLFAQAVDRSGVTFATGFAINEDHVVTVGHFCVPLVEGETAELFNEKDVHMVYVDFFGQTATKGGFEVIAVDEYNDTCLLRKRRHGIRPVRFIDRKEHVDMGDRIAISGGPLGIYPSVSFGHITNPDEILRKIGVISGNNRMVLTVDTCAGNSGSPVILIDEGVVVGMVYAGPGKVCSNLSYAVTAKQIKRFLIENGQQFLE